LKLTKYDLDVQYVPGKQQVISDCVSRAPIENTQTLPEDEIGVNLIKQLGLASESLEKFLEATGSDDAIQVVINYVLRGWPSCKDQADQLASDFWSCRESLSVENGLLFKSDRLVVPLELRGDILNEIHGAHMGEAKSLSFGRDYVFWPGMTAQIKDKVKSCSVCNSFQNQQQKETLHPHEIPDLPWQIVGTDIFQFQGQQYLLVTDFYSKYFEVELLRQSTASCVINNLKKIFARFGIPEKVVSDNGSQYSNTRNVFGDSHEFKKFAKSWGFQHITSSPEYPQSNGAAERAVQTAKRIFRKSVADNKDPFEGLLKYRNTPFEDIGSSPVQLLMGRRTRTMIPTHRRLLLPQTPECAKVVKGLQHRQLVSKKYYDRSGRDLPPLEVGDKVRICPNRENKWRSAEVLPRSYVVQDESGSVYRRNRKQIISVPKDGDHTLQPKAVVAPELSPDLMPDSILMDPPEPTI
jgi:hypothetical protein